MAYNISSFAGAGAQFFDNNANVLSGGLLYVYTAGTTTPATTWTTSSGAVANTNPIVLDSAGRTPNEIWLNSGVTYKFVLKTSAGVTIGTYDDIPAIGDPSKFNNLITVSGTNALIGTAVPPYTAYVTGMALSFIPINTNTGAVTIDLDGLGARNIYVGSSSPLSGGELIAGQIASVEYDGTRFQLAVSSIADGSVTTAKLANGAVTSTKLTTSQLTFSNAINGAVPVTLASAATVNIGAAGANSISITGTTTITGFDTIAAGATRRLTFADAVVLTYNATALILPGAANITTGAGDTAEFLSLGSGNWRCTAYQKASGYAISSAGTDVQTFNSTSTWTKPSTGQTMARIQVWGGGGGGRTGSGPASGGGGGYNEITVPLSYLAATVTATVGAGGTGSGTTPTAGGVSSFALATPFNGVSTIYAYGGAAAASSLGGAGGGQLSTGGAGPNNPSLPKLGSPAYFSDGTISGVMLIYQGTGAGVGSASTLSLPPSAGFWHGGGGANSTNTLGADSEFGGGGGSNSTVASTSVYGGAGATTAAAAVQPGGGGASSTNANGAAGRIVVTCW